MLAMYFCPPVTRQKAQEAPFLFLLVILTATKQFLASLRLLPVLKLETLAVM